MPMDRFYISPFDSNSGLQTNVKPFMITDQAFAELNNAYAWRGRIRKRFGSRWLGDTQLSTRLRMTVDTLSGGFGSGTVPSGSGAIGQMFSIGTTIYTVNQLGTPANLLVDGEPAIDATFNTTTGAFDFDVSDIPDGTPIFWYPALPVMGMATFENASIGNLPNLLIAFDTSYSYTYTGGATPGWDRITGETNSGDSIWTGDNSEYFWFTTWIGADPSQFTLFVTNFNKSEPNFMRYLYNNTWTTFRPKLSATGPLYLDSALILIPFHNRLLAFNLWENNNGTQTQYPNRVRWSGPAYASPIDNTGTSYYPWSTDTQGQNGSGLDCPTTEAIVTVQYIKDRLIVFLEESTWELVYRNNEVAPFAWQQINTELGVESTFSIVPFDKVAIGIGNVGVIACTGNNTERIDEKIPDEVFKIHSNDEGVERVYGIRDYYVEMIYWTFPDPTANANQPFPNRVLVYNYENGTWAFNDDSFTVFGYFQPAPTGIHWSSETITWDSDVTWDDGSVQALFRQVAAGNQQGWTFIIDADSSINAPSLQITDITISVAGSNQITFTSIDHNLRQGDYVYFQDIAGSGNLNLINGTIFPVLLDTGLTPNSFVILYQDSNQSVVAGTYTGGGVISRVSQIQLLTKEYNFYMDKGRNATFNKVDFLVDRTQFGQIQVDFYVSTADLSMLADSNSITGTGTLLGTGILETYPYPTIPLEMFQSQLWHPYYLQAEGEFIQLNIQLNDDQMRNVQIMNQQFQLHSMIFHSQPTGYHFR